MVFGSLFTGTARAFVFGSGKQLSQWMQGGASLIQLRNETNSVRIGSSGALYIDTASGKVGIGTTVPGNNLEVRGNFSAGVTGAEFVVDASGNVAGGAFNGLALASQPVGFTIAGGTSAKTLTVPSDASVSGANTGDQIINLIGDISGSGTSTFATTIGSGRVTNGMLSGSIASSKFVGTDIATLGTITAGTWNGSVINPQYGGAGVANGTNNTLTFTGNYTLGLTLTGNTTVTLPTGGTLLTDALTSANIFVGNGSNVATGVAVSGDVTIDNTGAATIGSGKISLAKMANLAANSIIGNNTGSAATPLALSASDAKTLLSLNSVENTALSTWVGTSNITTLGTIGTGAWNATAIADGKIASALTGKTYNGLTPTAAATGFTITGGSSTSKTLTVGNDASVSGTNTGDQTLAGLGGATIALDNLASVAMNASLQWDNTVARTFDIAATANTVAGQPLTISAGSTVTGGTADMAGGNLTLNSGLGKGTGASSIIFQTGRTLTTGSTLQTLTTAMMISGKGNVGIGLDSPSDRLAVQGSTSTSAAGALAITNNSASSLLYVRNDGNVGIGTASPGAILAITQYAFNTGSPTGLLFTGGAHTTLTAGAEASDINFNLARTVQFNAGALATQRAVLFQPPAYGFVGASTLTNAATVAISGAPQSRTNATITNTHGLLIQAGAVKPAGAVTNSYGLTVNAQTGATNNYAAQFIGGNVGIGTASPAAPLEIKGQATGTPAASLDLLLGSSTTSDPQDIRIKSNVGAIRIIASPNPLTSTPDGASFQLWGTASALPGQAYFDSGANDSAAIVFRTAITSGSITERMRITSTGNVGIGTTSPSHKLDVLQTGTTTGLAAIKGLNSGINVGTAYGVYGTATGGSQTNVGGYFSATNGVVNNYGLIVESGNVGIGTATPSYQLQLSTDSAAKPSTNAWTVASDARLKTNIVPFTDGLSVITKINPVNYTYNGLGGMPAGLEGIGIIAQDIMQVAPYTVSTYKARLNPRDQSDTDIYNFNSSALTFVMINAIKEQQGQIDNLKLSLDANGPLNATSTPAADFSDNHLGFVEIIRQVLAKLGIAIQNGAAQIKKAVIGTARLDKMEMIDQATGETYCTWIANGEWVKVKGSCDQAVAIPAAAPVVPPAPSASELNPSSGPSNTNGAAATDNTPIPQSDPIVTQSPPANVSTTPATLQ